MKTIKYILVLIIAAVFLTGCDKSWYVENHYVTFQNTDQYRYITSMYYQEYGDSRWSKNQVYSYVYPGDHFDMLLYQGIYNFEIVMEDDEYSYTFYQDEVALNGDMTIEVCYDCYRDGKIKVEKKLKEIKK